MTSFRTLDDLVAIGGIRPRARRSQRAMRMAVTAEPFPRHLPTVTDPRTGRLFPPRPFVRPKNASPDFLPRPDEGLKGVLAPGALCRWESLWENRTLHPATLPFSRTPASWWRREERSRVAERFARSATSTPRRRLRWHRAHLTEGIAPASAYAVARGAEMKALKRRSQPGARSRPWWGAKVDNLGPPHLGPSRSPYQRRACHTSGRAGVDVCKSLCEHDLGTAEEILSHRRRERHRPPPYDVVVQMNCAQARRSAPQRKRGRRKRDPDIGPAAVEARRGSRPAAPWSGTARSARSRRRRSTPPRPPSPAPPPRSRKVGAWSLSPAAATRSRRSIRPALPTISPSSRPPAAPSSNGWKASPSRASKLSSDKDRTCRLPR